tara:strand:- start:320 stop:925 length:606 start_codon:yes stop_codon:yes gene_type:complete
VLRKTAKEGVVSCESNKIPYPYTEDQKIHNNESKKYKEHNKSTVFSGPKEEWEGRLSIEKKSCSKCGSLKYIKDFAFNCSGNCHFNKEGYRHTRPECRECNKKEGLTCKKAMTKSKKAGNPTKAPPGTTCELCGKSKTIVYDHDHENSTFRGWLCDPCNRGLGQCGDNIKGLMKRLNYLISKKIEIPKIIQDPESGILYVS